MDGKIYVIIFIVHNNTRNQNKYANAYTLYAYVYRETTAFQTANCSQTFRLALYIVLYQM